MVRDYGKAIGVTIARHDLRKPGKLQGNAALEQIQLLLGHASIVTTIGIWASGRSSTTRRVISWGSSWRGLNRDSRSNGYQPGQGNTQPTDNANSPSRKPHAVSTRRVRRSPTSFRRRPAPISTCRGVA